VHHLVLSSRVEWTSTPHQTIPLNQGLRLVEGDMCPSRQVSVYNRIGKPDKGSEHPFTVNIRFSIDEAEGPEGTATPEPMDKILERHINHFPAASAPAVKFVNQGGVGQTPGIRKSLDKLVF